MCCLCGSRHNVEVGHINGDEDDSGKANLFWTCRVCNVRCANALRRAGIGRLTVQNNPASQGAKSLAQWLTAVTSMKGENDAMTVGDAVAMIRATPPEDRSRFAREIWTRRRRNAQDHAPF